MSAHTKLSYIQLCKYSLLARQYISSGDSESALNVIETIEPTLSEAWMSWGYAYFMLEKANLLCGLGELDMAIAVLENKVKHVYPGSSWYQSIISRKIAGAELLKQEMVAA